jgi:Pilus formation protein N terminal region
MSAVFGRRAKRCAVLALALFLALVGGVIGFRPAHAETLNITVDQASVLKLPPQVATIVVGNPLVADASLQKGGVLILTGKGYGTTNLMALDRAGKVVLEKTLQVLGPAGRDFVVVYRGVERETYSCAPDCERRLTLGDSPVYFSNVLAQSGARNAAAK